jgi:hypothetical protein
LYLRRYILPCFLADDWSHQQPGGSEPATPSRSSRPFDISLGNDLCTDMAMLALRMTKGVVSIKKEIGPYYDLFLPLFRWEC